MEDPSASGFPETAFSLEDLLVGNPDKTNWFSIWHKYRQYTKPGYQNALTQNSL